VRWPRPSSETRRTICRLSGPPGPRP
jgi:hypothetical protein